MGLTYTLQMARDYISSNIEIEPDTHCWVWKALSTDDSRRPVLCRRLDRAGTEFPLGMPIGAMAYRLWYHRRVHPRAVVRTCPNPRCVNPHHHAERVARPFGK